MISLTTQEELKEKEEYQRYQKRTEDMRTKLHTFVNLWAPYDYGFILKMMKVQLEGMLEYYQAGDNVWGIDNQDSPSRLEICKHLLELYKIYEDALGWDEEEKALKDFFDYLKEYIFYLWD